MTITAGFSETSDVTACAPALVFQLGSRSSNFDAEGFSSFFRPAHHPSVRSKFIATGTNAMVLPVSASRNGPWNGSLRPCSAASAPELAAVAKPAAKSPALSHFEYDIITLLPFLKFTLAVAQMSPCCAVSSLRGLRNESAMTAASKTTPFTDSVRHRACSKWSCRSAWFRSTTYPKSH